MSGVSLAERNVNMYGGSMISNIRKWLATVGIPNASVWRSWEQLTRTAGLASIGLSLFVQGDAVNPWSFTVGAALLVFNTWTAHMLGRVEAEKRS